jgi:hypothetical protein
MAAAASAAVDFPWRRDLSAAADALADVEELPDFTKARVPWRQQGQCALSADAAEFVPVAARSADMPGFSAMAEMTSVPFPWREEAGMYGNSCMMLNIDAFSDDSDDEDSLSIEHTDVGKDSSCVCNDALTSCSLLSPTTEPAAEPTPKLEYQESEHRATMPRLALAGKPEGSALAVRPLPPWKRAVAGNGVTFSGTSTAQTGALVSARLPPWKRTADSLSLFTSVVTNTLSESALSCREQAPLSAFEKNNASPALSEREPESEASADSPRSQPDATAGSGSQLVCSLEVDAPPSFTVVDLLRWRMAVSNNDHNGDIVYVAVPAPEQPDMLASIGGASGSSSLPKGRFLRFQAALEREATSEGIAAVNAMTTKPTKSLMSMAETVPGATIPAARPAPLAASSSLESSPTSWAAQQRLRRGGGGSSPSNSEAASDAVVTRVVKSLLNKLTIEKFSSLSRQITDIKYGTVEHVTILIKEIFEKATTQHHYIEMYGDLCELLQAFFQENPVSVDPKQSFKRLLLNECQNSFERNLQPPKNMEDLDFDERMEAEVKYKTRMLGNIRFVGALLVRHMLASKVLISILQELLGEPTAEALETVAALLTVTGPAFDKREWSHDAAMSAIFVQVQQIASKKSCCARVRCLLQDLLDLRKQGWQDRKIKKIEAATTLQAVAEKRAKEEAPKSPKSQEEWTTIGAARMSVTRWG